MAQQQQVGSDCEQIHLMNNRDYYGIYDSREYDRLSTVERNNLSKRLQKQFRFGLIDKNCRDKKTQCPEGYTNRTQGQIKSSFKNKMNNWSRCLVKGGHQVCKRVFPSDNDDLTRLKCCANIEQVERDVDCSPKYCFQSEECDGFMKSFCKNRLNVDKHPQWAIDQCACINSNPQNRYYTIEDEKVYIDSACICASMGGYRLPEHRGDCAQTICILNNVQAKNINQDCKAAIFKGNVIDPGEYQVGEEPTAADEPPSTLVIGSSNWKKWALIGGLSLLGIISLIVVFVVMTKKKKPINRNMMIERLKAVTKAKVKSTASKYIEKL